MLRPGNAVLLSLTVLAAGAVEKVARADDVPAQVSVATSDGKGRISVDGKVVGEGTFTGSIASGGHVLRVEREGFVPFEKQIALRAGEVYGESVTLVREPARSEPPSSSVLATGAGAYGGFQIGPVFQVGSSGSALGSDCSLFGAVSCAAPMPVGFWLGAFFGYSWDPVGLEVYGTGGADYHEPSATYDGVVQPGSNPVLTGPPRQESWRVLRAGGGAAIRARVIWDLHPRFRLTFALGPGFAARNVISERRVVATGSGAEDSYGPPSLTYASAALSLDVGAHLRLSRGATMTLGLWGWVESAGNGVVTEGDASRVLILPTGPVPLRTPEYRLFQGPQVFLGPYVGMQFGP